MPSPLPTSSSIAQLGGSPNWSPEGLATRAHAQDVERDSPRMMIEDILKQDDGHTDDLAGFLEDLAE